jgi:hypothetical protein
MILLSMLGEITLASCPVRKAKGAVSHVLFSLSTSTAPVAQLGRESFAPVVLMGSAPATPMGSKG